MEYQRYADWKLLSPCRTRLLKVNCYAASTVLHVPVITDSFIRHLNRELWLVRTIGLSNNEIFLWKDIFSVGELMINVTRILKGSRYGYFTRVLLFQDKLNGVKAHLKCVKQSQTVKV